MGGFTLKDLPSVTLRGKVTKLEWTNPHDRTRQKLGAASSQSVP
jgi:hypothetical protein